jgi:hypothetical protein
MSQVWCSDPAATYHRVTPARSVGGTFAEIPTYFTFAGTSAGTQPVWSDASKTGRLALTSGTAYTFASALYIFGSTPGNCACSTTVIIHR